MTGKKRRIAFVVQRYGEEVNGGAELHARWLAERLQALAEVQVITTCALDYTTWANHYPAGQSALNGVTIHRFPVDKKRRWSQAQKQTSRLVSEPHTLFAEMEWVKAQGPYSTPLFRYIQQKYMLFDLFIFVTYSYATTFFGLPLVSNKAILIPTAHQEPYLYLPLFRPIFHLPQVIVYNTDAERHTVNRATHNYQVPAVTVGVGINVPTDASAARFRQKYGLNTPFLLYAGRISAAKNVPELIDHFLRFKEANASDLKLVLVGQAHIKLPRHPDIVPVGFVSEQDKFDAIRAAAVVVMPSLYESLSMLALEAWLMDRPMLVNGRCEVLKHQCRQSNGGLYYTSYDEFEAALHCLLKSADLQSKLGRQGHQFVTRRYNWDIVMSKYEAIFDALL